MSKKQRIEQLEREVADLKRRMAEHESRPVYVPYYLQTGPIFIPSFWGTDTAPMIPEITWTISENTTGLATPTTTHVVCGEPS